MRELRIIEFLSLDGVMQAPAYPEEDTEGGFRHGGWQGPYFDDVLGKMGAEAPGQARAYLFGRKTYEKMAAYWPTVGDEDPFARSLNHTPKHVASRTLTSVEWEAASLIEGDVAAAVAALKEEPGGPIAVLGSGDLVQTLIAHDLIDVYFMAIFPIVLGSGKRLFREYDDVKKLKLADQQTTTTGGLLLTYLPER